MVMAIKIDDSTLDELGLGSLTSAEKQKMLGHIRETLELRVGTKLADQMSEAQLDEFEQFIDSNDQTAALKWLETNFPRYPEVVQTEFEALKTEIKRDAPKILAASSK